jgi:hypothetical protein
MTHSAKTLRYMLAGILLGIAVGSSLPVSAQDVPNASAKPNAKRIYDGGRDPFRRYEVARPVPKKISNVVGMPSIQERIAQYRAQKAAAMSARMPAPKPTTALLLSEMQVIGISRSPRGYAAIVEATPIKLSYVLYPGERFYDGQLVAIEDNRLIFRRETVFSDGRRERSVEIKTLRQAATAEDMARVKGLAEGTVLPDANKKPDEKAAEAGRP